VNASAAIKENSSDAWVTLFELYHEVSLLEKSEHCLRQAALPISWAYPLPLFLPTGRPY
jgi:hypothetical protein